MKTPEEQFQNELENFRLEIDISLQLLFAYLSIHAIAARNKKILEVMNHTPLFWNTNSYALQCSCFITLGRIFDQNSKHNIDRVLGIAQENLNIFSKESLAQRKRQLSENADEWLNDYMKDVYEPTIKDFRRLRRLAAKYRRIYEQGYRDIRHKIFAHREVVDKYEIDKLFQNTNITDMQKLSVFLSKLHDALWQLFHNGRKPVLKQVPFSAKQILIRKLEEWRQGTVQERIVNDTKKLLTNLKTLKRQIM